VSTCLCVLRVEEDEVGLFRPAGSPPSGPREQGSRRLSEATGIHDPVPGPVWLRVLPSRRWWTNQWPRVPDREAALGDLDDGQALLEGLANELPGPGGPPNLGFTGEQVGGRARDVKLRDGLGGEL
jgi:hypothetical protein